MLRIPTTMITIVDIPPIQAAGDLPTVLLLPPQIDDVFTMPTILTRKGLAFQSAAGMQEPAKTHSINP